MKGGRIYKYSFLFFFYPAKRFDGVRRLVGSKKCARIKIIYILIFPVNLILFVTQAINFAGFEMNFIQANC